MWVKGTPWEYLHVGEDPEKGLGGDMESLSREKAAQHKRATLTLKTSDLTNLCNNQSLKDLHSFSLQVTENISRGEGQHSGINNPCLPLLRG